MKWFAAVFIWVLIPCPSFSGDRWFSVFPSGSLRNEPESFPGGELTLSGLDPGSQSSTAGVPASPSVKPAKAKKQRPHLIELSSANWRPLTRKEKFELFSYDLLHWDVHASIAFDSGLSFATGDRPYLGNGVKGYFTRYGLNVADEANFCFFSAFLFPAVFHQDPRYIPRDKGNTAARLAYALTRVILTRGDSGESEINRSHILGTLISTSVSSAMYSSYGADVGVGGNFTAFGFNMGTDAGYNVFKEFWPDVARKMRLGLWLRNLVRASLRDEIRVS